MNYETYRARTLARVERRRREERRDQAIETLMLVGGVLLVLALMGVCGGIERGTIHVLGL
jgi:hypothetical protein